MLAFLVERVFSFFLLVFLITFLVKFLFSFFKFPPQLLINGYEMPPVKAENIVSDSRWRFIQYPVINYASSIEDRILPAEDFSSGRCAISSPRTCVLLWMDVIRPAEEFFQLLNLMWLKIYALLTSSLSRKHQIKK